MDPSQLVVPVVGIVAVAALTFYVVSFTEMSAKSFDDYDAKIDNSPETQLKSALSSKKRREARQAAKQKKPDSPPGA